MKNELLGSGKEGVMVTLLVGNLATVSRSCCSVVRQEKAIFDHGGTSDEMEIRKKERREVPTCRSPCQGVERKTARLR